MSKNLLTLAALMIIAILALVSGYVLALAAITDASLDPGEGILTIGGTATATLTTDEVVLGRLEGGACTINGVDVSHTFHNNNDGTYTFIYVVQEGNANRGPGAIPVSCTLRDLEGATITANSWTDGNTLAVDATRPRVASAHVSSGLARVGRLDVEMVFSEPMDTKILPIVGFGESNEDIASRGDGFWSDDRTWKEAFDVLNSGKESVVVATVSDATDAAGNVMIDNNSAASFFVDTLAPSVTLASIASGNEDGTLARQGEEVILTFETSEKINAPAIAINGNPPDSLTNTVGNTWIATRRIIQGELKHNDRVAFSIDFSDIAGNSGVRVTNTTDGSYLVFEAEDNTPPQLHIADPEDGFISFGIVSFAFRASDDRKLDDASLLINGAVASTKTNPANDTEQQFSLMLGDGIYTWRIRAFDAAGNMNESANRTLIVDSSGPTTTAYAVGQSGLPYKFNTSASGTVLINFTCHSSVPSCEQTMYCIDMSDICTPDNVYNAQIRISAEGQYYMRFRSTDSLGQLEQTKSRIVRINKTDPEVSISYPEDGSYISGRSVTIIGTAFDLNPGKISISNTIFGSNTGNYTNWKFNSPALADGTYSISVTADDSFGHFAKDTIFFVVDTTAPKNISFIFPTPSNGSLQSSRSYTVNVTFNETNPVLCLLDDGLENLTMKLSEKGCVADVFSQHEGTKQYKVWVKDRAGNIAVSSARLLSIDTKAPILSGVFPLNNTVQSSGSATFSTTMSETAMKNLSLYINGVLKAVNTSGLPGTYRFVQSLEDGIYTWRIIAYDLAGNSMQSRTRVLIIDTKKPSVQIVASARKGNFSSIVVNVTADDTNLKNVIINLFNSSSFVKTAVFGAANISMNFTNLTDGVYMINVTAFDAAGNSNSTQVNLLIDTMRPSVKINTLFNKAVQSANTAVFNSSVSDKNLANVSLFINGLVNETNMSGMSGNYVFVKTLPDGTYNWSIQASDKAGMKQSRGGLLTIRKESAPTLSPPSSPPRSESGSSSGSSGSGGGYSGGGVTVIPKEEEKPAAENEVRYIQDNTQNLDQALESVLTINELTEEAKRNLLEISQTVSTGTEVTTSHAQNAENTTVFTNVVWNGSATVNNLIVHVTIPKSFSNHADNITVWARGAKVLVVDPDPEYLIVYDVVSPGQQLNISHTVNASLDSAYEIAQNFSAVIYAESLSQLQICTPSQLKCFENTLEKCTPDGLSWSVKKSCRFGCANMACKSEPQSPQQAQPAYSLYDILRYTYNYFSHILDYFLTHFDL